MSSSPASKSTLPFPIWPHVAPGSQAVALQESVQQSGAGKTISIRGISCPTLTPFLPAQPGGTGVIVLPGGAYTQLVFDKEGTELAEWLCAQGITAFVLKYRLPVEGHEDAHHVAMQDVQRAIRLIRARSKDFGLDPAKIGVLGASSGGHLAAAAGTAFSRQLYAGLDAFDALSARPDFMLLLYGAYTGNMHFTHASREQLFFPEAVKNRLYAEFPAARQVSAQTPPALLIATDNDNRVNPENSSAMFLALRRSGIPAELHIHADGGHGFALRAPASQSIATWPETCLAWLRRHAFL